MNTLTNYENDQEEMEIKGSEIIANNKKHKSNLARQA